MSWPFWLRTYVGLLVALLVGVLLGGVVHVGLSAHHVSTLPLGTPASTPLPEWARWVSLGAGLLPALGYALYAGRTYAQGLSAREERDPLLVAEPLLLSLLLGAAVARYFLPKVGGLPPALLLGGIFALLGVFGAVPLQGCLACLLRAPLAWRRTCRSVAAAFAAQFSLLALVACGAWWAEREGPLEIYLLSALVVASYGALGWDRDQDGGYPFRESLDAAQRSESAARSG